MTKTTPQQLERLGRSSSFPRMTLSRRMVSRYDLIVVVVVVVAALLLLVEPNATFGADAFAAFTVTPSRKRKLQEQQRKMRVQERQIRNEMLLPKLNIRNASYLNGRVFGSWQCFL